MLSLLKLHEGTDHWQEGLLQLFRYLEANRQLCRSALGSVGYEHVHRLFESDIYEILHKTIEDTCAELKLGDGCGFEPGVELLTHFYVSALKGILVSWIEDEI